MGCFDCEKHGDGVGQDRRSHRSEAAILRAGLHPDERSGDRAGRGVREALP